MTHTPLPSTLPEVLLLDFGGTLVREVPGRAAIYAEAATGAGLEVTEARMAELMATAHRALPRVVGGGFRYSGPWFERFMGSIFADGLGLSSADLPAVMEALFARFSDAATFEVFPGTREVLEACARRGIRTGLVSNWGDRLDELVGALDLRFDVVVSSALERMEKPDPALFSFALHRLGAAPARAVHVGDSIGNDVTGARRAGITPVFMDRVGHGPLEGCATLQGLDELTRWITAP